MLGYPTLAMLSFPWVFDYFPRVPFIMTCVDSGRHHEIGTYPSDTARGYRDPAGLPNQSAKDTENSHLSTSVHVDNFYVPRAGWSTLMP